MNNAFFEQIEAAVIALQGSHKGSEITFLCPAHDDHRPSAAWNINKHVWHCFVCGAGGGAYDLAKRLGVDTPTDPASGLTLLQISDYVGLPADFLRSNGLSEGVSGSERAKCVDIPYLNDRGEVTAVRKRLRLGGEPRMIWRRGDKTSAYGLGRLALARAAGYVILVEGESDSWTCWFAGVAALGLPGASSSSLSVLATTMGTILDAAIANPDRWLANG